MSDKHKFFSAIYLNSLGQAEEVAEVLIRAAAQKLEDAVTDGLTLVPNSASVDRINEAEDLLFTVRQIRNDVARWLGAEIGMCSQADTDTNSIDDKT